MVNQLLMTPFEPITNLQMTENKKSNIIDFFKENKWTFIIVLAILMFYEPISNLANTIFVKPILSKLASTWWKDLIIITCCIIAICISFVKRKQQYILAEKHFVRNSTIFTLYLGIRLFDKSFQYTGLSIVEEIKYLDILCTTFLACNVILKLTIENDKPQNTNQEVNGFEIDEPILSVNNLIDTKWDTSQEIIDNILNTKLGKGSYVIGLNGEWGSGKTTYWYLMKEKLKKQKNYIIIEFNPWNNESDTSITQNFLNRFKNEVSKYHSNINPEIDKYSKTLSQTCKNGILKTLTSFVSKNQNSAEDELTKLKKTISNINKTIIIFIDDIDRLCNDEIYEVLKLVRNNANFPNTFFILAYDREYIEVSLSNLSIPKSTQYLEKIINHEHILPNLKQQILLKALEDLLTKELKLIPKDKELFIIEFSKLKDYSTSFFSLISNYRDIKKLSNLILGKYLKLKTETQLSDLILIETLRLKHPMMFKPLQENKINFLKWTKLEGKYPQMDKNQDLSFPHREDEEKANTIATDKIFNKILGNTTISEQDQDKIISFFYEFAATKRIEYPKEHNKYLTLKSFTNRFSFDTYIDSKINDKKFTFKKFENWKKKDPFDIEQINKWLKNSNTKNIFISALESIERFTNSNEFRNINRGMLKIIVEKRTSEEEKTNIETIKTKLENNIARASQDAYFLKNNENVQDLFIEILSPIEFPFSNEIKIAKYQYNNQTANNPKTRVILPKTFKKLTKLYLVEYLKKKEKQRIIFDEPFENFILNLMLVDKTRIKDTPYNEYINNTVKEALLDVIKNKYYIKFWNRIIQRDVNKMCSIRDDYNSLFGILFENINSNEFENFLQEMNKFTKYQKEHKELFEIYKQYKENSFQNFSIEQFKNINFKDNFQHKQNN